MVELLFGVFCLQKLSLSATIGKERKLFVLAKSKKKKKKKKEKKKIVSKQLPVLNAFTNTAQSAERYLQSILAKVDFWFVKGKQLVFHHWTSVITLWLEFWIRAQIKEMERIQKIYKDTEREKHNVK